MLSVNVVSKLNIWAAQKLCMPEIRKITGIKHVHLLKIKLFPPGIVASGGRFHTACGRYKCSSGPMRIHGFKCGRWKHILTC